MVFLKTNESEGDGFKKGGFKMPFVSLPSIKKYQFSSLTFSKKNYAIVFIVILILIVFLIFAFRYFFRQENQAESVQENQAEFELFTPLSTPEQAPFQLKEEESLLPFPMATEPRTAPQSKSPSSKEVRLVQGGNDGLVGHSTPNFGVSGERLRHTPGAASLVEPLPENLGNNFVGQQTALQLTTAQGGSSQSGAGTADGGTGAVNLGAGNDDSGDTFRFIVSIRNQGQERRIR